MVHDTVTELRADLNKWLPVFKAALGLSQNAFARGAEIDPSIFSRWYRGEITSEPSAKKAARHLARLKRRVLATNGTQKQEGPRSVSPLARA